MNQFFENLSHPLIVLDIANNHNGSLEHGKQIIDEIYQVTQEFNIVTVVKFQYRELDTFIHENYKGDSTFKYIKRFEETRLSDLEFESLIEYARSKKFLLACTPFDEPSVDKINLQKFDILKIASVSLTDWPLLNKIASQGIPVLASTAGSSLEEIDRVVKFLSKRVSDFALMHCVATYPTPDNELKLNRIDTLRTRYEPTIVGYSTHEDPKNVEAVKMAIAKGAKILERHVGSSYKNNIVNKYSSEMGELRNWLIAIQRAVQMSKFDEENDYSTPSEEESLKSLRRGVYLKSSIIAGESISSDKVFFAIPLLDGQLSANQFSDYTLWKSKTDAVPNSPLYINNLEFTDLQSDIQKIAEFSREMLKKSKLTLPKWVRLEISHHYGVNNFDTFGLVMINLVNRNYCKKILILKSGQKNPEHYHKLKEETFYCIYGQAEVYLESKIFTLVAGESLLVPIGVRHTISSKHGAVLEEISTQSFSDDSYYTDKKIQQNEHRKSFITIWT